MYSNKEMVDLIIKTPSFWWKEDNLNTEKAPILFEKFNNPIKFKKNWCVIPFFTKGRFGRTTCLKDIDKEERFHINVFNGSSYNLKTTNYIYSDASFAFVFQYNKENAFYVSFLFDNNNNFFIRQIQGFPKSNIHNILGKNWKQIIVSYLNKNFNNFNNFYLISEKSVIESIKSLYGDSYYDELHNPIIERVEKNYRHLRESICFKNIKINKFSPESQYSSRSFNDCYFKINKNKTRSLK